MKKHRIIIALIASLPLFPMALPSSATDDRQPLTLFDFGASFQTSTVATSDARVSLAAPDRLRIETGHEAPWPGVTLKAPDGRWDLSGYETIEFEVANRGDRSVTVNCRVDNPGADGTNHCATDNVTVAPGASETLTVRVFPVPWRLDAPLELVGMRSAPTHAGKLDPSNVTQLVIFVNQPKHNHTFEIGHICASGCIEMLDASTFLPFIDTFGQYIHKDWPGKTHSIEDLIARAQAEEQDIETHPGPQDRNVYGGWERGPQLEATGFFRVQKHQGKWWLVDPAGRLFWSHGIDCVGTGNATPITNRETYFQNLPPEGSSFARFYGSGSWAPHGYYKDHAPYRTYDFSRANLLRKYGKDFERLFAERTHQRFRSWGINTIANWSDESIYLMRKTPYTATIHFESKHLEGSEGYWGKFYDVFDPRFREQLRKRLARERDRTANDPWCIGYFVHNELSWGNDTSLAFAALASPADQPAKKVFVEDLKAKYETISRLNEAWGTDHASWEAFLQSQTAPDRQKALADLHAFYDKTARTYFETIRDELRKVAPHHLYLGCRFAWVNDIASRAAADFCDVVSYNRYTYSVEDLKLPDEIDMPLIIGEFHFGALDRGMFHTGLRATNDQQDRAEKYANYVRGALRNPHIVGTHWFQYKDQATTGRGDGENYQIGFIDVCDTPYPEIVAKARQVGDSMYPYRLNDD